MADTLPPIELDPSDWVAVSVVTGGAVAIGAQMIITSMSPYKVQSAISVSKPSLSFIGVPIGPDAQTKQAFIGPGENEVWLRGTGLVSVQLGG